MTNLTVLANQFQKFLWVSAFEIYLVLIFAKSIKIHEIRQNQDDKNLYLDIVFKKIDIPRSCLHEKDRHTQEKRLTRMKIDENRYENRFIAPR